MKTERGPAVARSRLRWALPVFAAVALATGAIGCSGSGGEDRPPEPADPLTAALSYLPPSTGLVAVVPTADTPQVRALERLGKSKAELRSRFDVALAAAGVQPAALRAQLGAPLALGFGATDKPLAAMRLHDPTALTRLIEERIDTRTAEHVDAPDDVLAWQRRGAAGTGGVAAIDRRELVVAASEADLERALEAGSGKDSIAYDDRFTAELRRLGGDSLLRSVGDAQRLLSRDPLQAAALRRIKWVRALGLLTGTARVERGKVRTQFQLQTDRVPLTVGDLPLAPGPRSPQVSDSRAPAAFAALDPDRLARFIEQWVSATNPDASARYETAVGQLKSLFSFDVHYDLFRQMRSISVAFSSPVALRFVAPVKPDAEAQVLSGLRRAEPAIQFGLPDFLPGAKLAPRGSPPTEWVVRRGKVVLGRYAVEDGAFIGAIGLAGLPPVQGHRVPGVDGSLVVVGDLRQLGRAVGLVFDLPARALEPVLTLGDVRLGVESSTEALNGSGYLQVKRR